MVNDFVGAIAKLTNLLKDTAEFRIKDFQIKKYPIAFRAGGREQGERKSF
jgi:hypothetical protein